MDEILNRLQAVDPDLKSYETDSAIHRFGKKKHGWYIASEKSGTRGDTIKVCTFGTWRSPGEKETVAISDHGYLVSKKEKNDLITHHSAMIEENQRKKRHNAATNALYILANYDTTGVSEYLAKKGIADVPDPWVRFQDGVLFVPCFDSDRDLHGMQQIMPTGSKYFMAGQRKSGCFHTFKGEAEEGAIILCEGYSTGASIFKALGELTTVIVAFDCGNLEAVGTALRKKYPEIAIIIAADDDRWKPEHIQKGINPGIDSAKKVASIIGAEWISPEFSDDATQPTDFNDLHLLEGLEEVRNQFYKVLNGIPGLPHYKIRHKTMEKLPTHVMVNNIIADHEIITTKSNVPYIYNGEYWRESCKEELGTIALSYDAMDCTSNHRRAETVAHVLNATRISDIPWRNLGPHDVPFKNGIFNLHYEIFREHAKNDYLETTIPHPYNPNASCSEWLQCLSDWFGGDADAMDKIVALQQFFGYILLPHARFKKALLCYGPPHTGKSVVTEIIRLLVGNENCCVIPVNLMDKPENLAPIKGKMVNLVSELPQGSLIADGGFKQLVSTGDAIQINEKYKQRELYVPFCKHIICTNTLPKINDQSSATYDRLLLVSFNSPIEEGLRDIDLIDKLEGEIDGIINWALLGAEILLANNGRFGDIQSSKDILDEHKRDQNPVTPFIEEYCTINENVSTPCSVMYKSFSNWHRGKPISHSWFGKLLKSMGYETRVIKTGTTTQRMVEGLSLKGSQW